MKFSQPFSLIYFTPPNSQNYTLQIYIHTKYTLNSRNIFIHSKAQQRSNSYYHLYFYPIFNISKFGKNTFLIISTTFYIYLYTHAKTQIYISLKQTVGFIALLPPKNQKPKKKKEKK